jgi:hypothetical protein
MGKPELDNLVRIKRLKLEPASRAEFDGMVRSARTHLADAQNESIGKVDFRSIRPIFA